MKQYFNFMNQHLFGQQYYTTISWGGFYILKQKT